MPIITPNKPTGTPPGSKPTPAQRQGPAIGLGTQQYNLGSGLLDTAVIGNGFGQVTMPQGPAMPTSQVAPNSFGVPGGVGAPQLNTSTTTNPWLKAQGRGIRNQTNDMLGQGLLGIQGQSVASGGLGGSRQGVAQGVAFGQAANYLSSNLADMYGSAHENQQNRNIQQYGIDSNNFLGQRGQDVTMRGQDLQTWNAGQDRNLQQYNSDQDFFTAQRGQDLAQIGMGAGLINQGLQTQWLPLQNAADVYSKFTGYGTQTNTSQQGGGWQGALGGALGLMNFGKDMGWYGGSNSGGSSGSGGWW